MLSKKLILFFGCGISACQPYKLPVSIVGNVHEVNQRKIDQLEKEVGDILFFDIQATVKSNKGIQRKNERVEAKIVGHKEFAGSLVRVYRAKYEHGKKLVFYNSEGKKLVIESRSANDLGSDYDGSLDYLIAGEIDGRYVSTKALRSPDSLKENGFQLLAYKAPLVGMTRRRQIGVSP